MIFLNCTHCDDMVVLTDRRRACLCGRCTGILEGKKPVVTGMARLAEIPWEDYDIASAGKWQRWRILRPTRKG